MELEKPEQFSMICYKCKCKYKAQVVGAPNDITAFCQTTDSIDSSLDQRKVIVKLAKDQDMTFLMLSTNLQGRALSSVFQRLYEHCKGNQAARLNFAVCRGASPGVRPEAAKH